MLAPAETRVAVVTGGASGLGLSICEHLAAAGHRVAVLDVDADGAERVAADLRAAGADSVAIGVDVSDPASVTASFEKVRTEFGAIQILVTSAAIVGFAPFDKITLSDWTRIIAVNLTGTFLCLQAAIADMTATGWGRIVTISSAAAQLGSQHQGHYVASKGGVIALTKTVAREYASQGITANTIPPYTADTPMLRAAQSAGQIPKADAIARMVPAGRVGTGEDIASACTFLCSEAASYITGQIIGVNGGAVL
ncbi:MAG TPA: SDR family NAD(P)-dependent oxidoreductase [Mycobacterium sp.]|nr:SDR family NAD(P)-dependent oxidoreductase [Mycobacterium sp.]